MALLPSRARRASDKQYLLAESPVWDPRTNRLYWVDIPEGAVIQGVLAAEEIREERRWPLGETVGAVCPAEDGTLLVAGQHALHRLHPERGYQETGPALIEGRRRLNDGACDPSGTYVVGSLDLDGRGGDEVLVHTGRGPAHPLRTGIGLSNGVGWSADGTTIYHVDSNRHTVSFARYDGRKAAAGEWAPLFEVSDATPDGLAIDADGMLWVACWGAGQVRRYNHRGEVLQLVDVDAPLTSSLTFAGEALDVLVITTARIGLSPAELAAHPASGALFLAHAGVQGRPSTRWRGTPSLSSGPGTGVK